MYIYVDFILYFIGSVVGGFFIGRYMEKKQIERQLKKHIKIYTIVEKKNGNG